MSHLAHYVHFVQVSFGFTVIYLLVAKSGNNVITVAHGDDDFHKVRDGLKSGWRMRLMRSPLKRVGTTLLRQFWSHGLNHSVLMHSCWISEFDFPHLSIQLASEGYGQ